MAILLHGSESQVYTPAQITKLNSLHYKVLRQILQIKSSYYHRVLDPSNADCSNHFLLQQAFVQVPGLLLPSQLISKNRLKYLGHILRHPTCIEHHLCFNNSLSLRTISSPFRRGAPRAHWPELALAGNPNIVSVVVAIIASLRPEIIFILFINTSHSLTSKTGHTPPCHTGTTPQDKSINSFRWLKIENTGKK